MWIGWYHRWRHAGEDGATAIYANTCRGTPLVVVCTIVTLCLFAVHLKILALVPLTLAAVAVQDIDKYRRAIIFTQSAVRWRPTFGKLREIPFKEIYMVRRTAATEGASRTPINVLAAELTLPYGEMLLIPLSMEGGEEALQRLLKCVPGQSGVAARPLDRMA